MRPTRSIRARLLAGILLSLLVILGTTAWWSYEVAKHESEELFGARLATSARVLEALVSRQLAHATVVAPIVITLPKELELSGSDEGSEFGHPYETKIAFQVWHADGTLLARSASASVQAFAPNVAGFSRRVIEGEPCHVFVLRSDSIWIQVAEKDEVRAELLHNLGLAVMTPLIVGAVLLLLVTNLLVVYGLAPLRQLTASIGRRAPDSLGALALRDVPPEVGAVVRALNDLLARMRLAFERERRFTDAAAHELRTPLAALKIHAENMMRAGSDAERAASLAKLTQGLDRTTKLAAQMLAYSRSQNASDSEPRVPIRLIDVVVEILAGLEPMRQARSQTVRLDRDAGAEQATIEGEPVKIERLMRNLIDNASRYAPAGSEIAVRLSADESTVTFCVANHGRVIPPSLRERVFEPYFRVLGNGSEGTGLGLAIVQEIATQHGATLELASLSDDDGTIVTVRFPAFRAARSGTARRVG